MENQAKEAVLLNQLNISAAGSGCQMRLGDIDNDGRLEIILIQPDTVSDERYFPHSVSAATAFNLEGDILWQIGTPAMDVQPCKADLPAQIYDLDNDGSNEFLCVMNGEFCIFEGSTGMIKLKYPLPAPDAHDCIVIANLEGNIYPQNILLKNKYHEMWAMDKSFNLLWNIKGNLGHVPVPFDLDGDGRDEIIAGYSVLSADGKVLWKADDVEHHPDCIWVSNLAQEKAAAPSIVFGGRQTRAYSFSGELLWSLPGVKTTRSIQPGNFRPDLKGIEIAGIDRSDADIDEIFLADYHGNILFKEKRTAASGRTIISDIYNFDGQNTDLLLACRGENHAVMIYDGMMNPVYTFPAAGYPFAADLLGDGIPQVLIHNNVLLGIYGAAETNFSGPGLPYGRPQPKTLYNATVYPCGEIEPWRYAPSYITGDFTTRAVYPWAETCAMCGGSEFDLPITRADFLVLLVQALELNGAGRDNFFDVKPCEYYYNATGAAKQNGLFTGVKLSPLSPLTAGDASEIMKKAGFNPIMQKTGEDILSVLDAAKLILQTRPKQ